jgi:hypothetical protein
LQQSAGRLEAVFTCVDQGEHVRKYRAIFTAVLSGFAQINQVVSLSRGYNYGLTLM